MTPPNITELARKCADILYDKTAIGLGQLDIASLEIQLALTAATAPLEKEIERLKEWKTAVEDACIVLHLGEALSKPPRECVSHLIAFENLIALDPAVSGEAVKLRDTFLSERDQLQQSNTKLTERVKELSLKEMITVAANETLAERNVQLKENINTLTQKLSMVEDDKAELITRLNLRRDELREITDQYYNHVRSGNYQPIWEAIESVVALNPPTQPTK